MIVTCPKCQVRLRPPQNISLSSKQVTCPRCLAKFKVGKSCPALTVLLAHEDEEVGRLLRERFARLEMVCITCSDENQILNSLQGDRRLVLLLDVAFNGSFPFLLIDKFKAAGREQHKVVLLSSVYNRTAYKKSPESLYGADAYLELHHIGDRLLPLLSELFPVLAARFVEVEANVTVGGERALAQAGDREQAVSLARLLVADILLYNQKLLEQGLEAGQLEQLFAEHLAEGRRMLAERLPAAEDFAIDFIQQAFDAACQTYSCH